MTIDQLHDLFENATSDPVLHGAMRFIPDADWPKRVKST